MSQSHNTLYFPSSDSLPRRSPPRRPLPPLPPANEQHLSPPLNRMAGRASMTEQEVPLDGGSEPHRAVPRSRSATSLPTSISPPSMGRRSSNSTVTKKTRIRRLRTSDRPATAPGPPSPDQPSPAPSLAPSSFNAKAGWFKRMTNLRSTSSLHSNKSEVRLSRVDTFSSSHSVLSKHDDVDRLGKGSADFHNFMSASRRNSAISVRGSTHASDGRLGRGEFGEREQVYDFLQALEIAPERPIVPSRPPSRDGAPRQAPPLIDLTGGIYASRAKPPQNRVVHFRPPSTPAIPTEVALSSLTGRSAANTSGSTVTAASSLFESPPRKASSDTFSTAAPGTPAVATTALPDTAAEDAKAQIPRTQAPPVVPVVLPITPKPKLTARKRAPTPPEQTPRAVSTVIPNSSSTPPSPLPRSVSSPALPDAYPEQCEPDAEEKQEPEEKEKQQREALAELLKESISQLATPAKAVQSSWSDPGPYLMWTTDPTVKVAVVIPPLPEPVLPRAPERAVVKLSRRQPQSPTIPAPRSPNLQLQPPIPSSISFPSPSPSSTPETGAAPSPPPSPIEPQTPKDTPSSPSPSHSSPPTRAITPQPTASSPAPGDDSAPPPPPSTSRTREPTNESTTSTTDNSSVGKTLAAISPEDMHVSQRTLLKPVVRKASDVSLKQFFKELDQTEYSKVEGSSHARSASDASGGMKKRSLTGITGVVAGGVSTVGVSRKKSKKRPTTAGAAVDLTKVKGPVATPALSIVTATSNVPMPSPTATAAALSLSGAAASSPSPSNRAPSTRRPRTATEPNHQQGLGDFALNRSVSGKQPKMDWDREANPWDDPAFRNESSVFREPDPAPRSRAKSEAGTVGSSSNMALGSSEVKKELLKSRRMSWKRPKTADSTVSKFGLLKKKSSQSTVDVTDQQQQQQQQPTSPTARTHKLSTGTGSAPPSSFSFKRSLTMRSRSKDKGKEKELPLHPPPPPVVTTPAPPPVDNDEIVPAISTELSSPSAFEPDSMLTMRDIFEASLINVWDKEGNRIAFGKLFEDQVTMVIFIRHFWCPMCQDYMKSIVKELEPGRLARARVKLIVIGCGDPAMIRSYNEKIVKSPFEMYTDPKLLLFKALGMTLKTSDSGSEEQKGEYVKHGSFRGTLNVIGRALFTMSPSVMVKRGGDAKQLGGEFVLGPGLRCRFAHRMSTTRNHSPIYEVAINAGVPIAHVSSPSKHIRTLSEDEDGTATKRSGLKKRKTIRRTSELLDFLPPLTSPRMSSTVCADEACAAQTNHIVGTI